MKFIETFSLLYISVFIICAIGWVLNIIDIVQTYMFDLTGLFVLRVVGIFIFPLGAILGIFT